MAARLVAVMATRRELVSWQQRSPPQKMDTDPNKLSQNSEDKHRFLVISHFLKNPELFSAPCMHRTSPERLCEDVTRFGLSQHYANRPRLAHARFGLLIITYGHPGLGRSVKGRIKMSAQPGRKKKKEKVLYKDEAG